RGRYKRSPLARTKALPCINRGRSGQRLFPSRRGVPSPRPMPRSKRASVMTLDEALLAGIVAHPEDPAARLVSADWLEGRGAPRAGYLRAQAGLIRHREDPAARLRLQSEVGR